MRRGELYLVLRSPGDPRPRRPVVVVSRQAFIDTGHSSVICAPIGSAYRGLRTEVLVGLEEGLKSDSAIHCDSLLSIRKTQLTNFIGSLNPAKQEEMNRALALALSIER